MNATQLIIDTLTACGCRPEVVKDKNGADVIKVNAPVINGKDNENK